MDRQDEMDEVLELLNEMDNMTECIKTKLAALKEKLNPIIDKNQEPDLREVNDSLRELDNRLNRIQAQSF